MEFEELKETVAVIQSGTSAIHLCGDDYSRMDGFVEQLALDLGFTESEETQAFGENGPETRTGEKASIVEWNYGYGQVDFSNRAKIGSPPYGEKIPFTKFLETYRDRMYAEERIILIRNARLVLEGEMNRENLAQLQQTILHLKKILPGRSVLIYCDERRFIPDELSSLVYFLDLRPPLEDELKDITRKFIKDNKLVLDEKSIEQLSSKCVGMSEDSFTQILKKAAFEEDKDFAEIVIPKANETKKQFVDKSGLLKYVNAAVDIDNDVGGLGYLKWWLRQKEKAFKDPKGAQKWGISPAKGILLVGMPGCGKSLTSKAVANSFKLPLLYLDLGSLMGKYLGESEENLRRALKLAENSSPCVLWVDEIEKAFAGVGGDESGVTQRLFGHLLTWLNDKTARVFVMATANDVAVLPPEFLRRGRFDEIFYVDFPNEMERKEIFKIHLGKAFKNFGGKEKVEEILANNEELRKKFEELTRDKTPEETGSDTGAVVDTIEQALRKRELYKKQLEERLGKEKYKEIFSDHYSAMQFEELIRDKKPEGKAGKNGKPGDKEKKKTGEYPGTEGYAGSDIEALVNTAVELAWNQGKNLEADIFDILLKQRVYMTPLKEVLAEKIERNREKFGQYKLKSASDTKENLERFETDSEGSEENQLALAKDDRCPAEYLAKMAKKGTAKVKLAVLENPNCPPKCIEELMEDADAEVREKALEKQSATPEGSIKIAQNGTKEQKLNLLTRQDIPEEALVHLANDGDKEIIETILRRQSIPDPVLAALLINARNDEAIKALLLNHPKFPEAKKTQLRAAEQGSDNPICNNCDYFLRKQNKCKVGRSPDLQKAVKRCNQKVLVTSRRS